MALINEKLRKKAWANAIAKPAQEFPLTPLPVISGTIPPGLRGTLYRNGPGRLERGGIHVGHWFDGDGAILGVHFNTPPYQGGTGGVLLLSIATSKQMVTKKKQQQANCFMVTTE